VRRLFGVSRLGRYLDAAPDDAHLPCAQTAHRHGFALLSIVADVERLPLRDRSVELAYVHDGLHHIERPYAGLAEMMRVAAAAVSVTEPARAAVTRAAAAVGIAKQVEEAGNVVERLSFDAVVGAVRAAGFEVTLAERYAMFYRHEPGTAMRTLSKRPFFPLARAAIGIGNLAFGGRGNKLTVQGVRRGP